MDVAGIILAGGLGSRMDGRDKALLMLGGEPLHARAARRLAPQVVALALNANGDPDRFGALSCAIVQDDGEAGDGPLAGVLAGLRWANGPDVACEALATVAVDTPFFPADLVRKLADAQARHGGIAVAASGGRRHPTFALWPLAIVDDLARHLSSGGSRKVMDFIDAHPNVAVDYPFDHRGDPFFNVNTPADLDTARERPGRRVMSHRVIGIAGWKNSGKTTLTERLVAELTGRGWRVSTVKRAHHDADIDRPGSDSHRHRVAGAAEVLLVTANRWALMHEVRGEAEPDLDTMLARLSPCDLVIVEGYKHGSHAKIETRRRGSRDHAPLPPEANVIAIASDRGGEDTDLPVFDLDAIAEIADFVEAAAGLR